MCKRRVRVPSPSAKELSNLGLCQQSFAVTLFWLLHGASAGVCAALQHECAQADVCQVLPRTGSSRAVPRGHYNTDTQGFTLMRGQDFCA